MSVLSFVFGALDTRTKKLIKLAESGLRKLEEDAGVQDIAPFSRDAAAKVHMTYTSLLRATFTLFFASGLTMASLAIVQLFGK